MSAEATGFKRGVEAAAAWLDNAARVAPAGLSRVDLKLMHELHAQAIRALAPNGVKS